jgi:hypothetical protein
LKKASKALADTNSELTRVLHLGPGDLFLFDKTQVSFLGDIELNDVQFIMPHDMCEFLSMYLNTFVKVLFQGRIAFVAASEKTVVRKFQ